MTRLDELEQFNESIVSYLDDDGYPISYPSGFRVEGDTILVERRGKLSQGTPVTLTFNHITPLPTGGYTDRRYVVVRGQVVGLDGWVKVSPREFYGWDEKKTPFPEYCEIKAPQAQRYASELVYKYGRKAGPKIPLPSLLFRSTRFPFIIATVVPVLIANTLAAYNGFFNPFLFIITLTGTILIHLGLNMSNDYFDYKLGADNINRTPTPFSGGSRIIQYGLLTPSAVARISTLFYLIGALIGAYLALSRGPIPILTLLAVGVLISVFYTAPPLKLSYRGLGEVAVGVGFGPVIVLGSYYVQAQEISASAVLASIPIGILIALILYVNQIPDIPYDRAAGKRTLVTRLSREGVINLYRALLAATYLIVVMSIVMGLAPPTTVIALLTVPYAARTVRMVRENFGNPYMMIPAMGANIRLATWTGLLHAVGFAAAAILNYFG
jgi:1,4-dihydroxy-2-naphthoate octaprenyltransferase